MRYNTMMMAVFFCVSGWVYSGSAIGADAADSTNPDAQVLFGDAPQAVDEDAPEAMTGVAVDSFGQVDLHVKNQDVTKVLQVLSIQSRKNIIASRNVAGAISADLYGVDFYEALDAILTPNNFAFREKGNFIYVYTAEEIKRVNDENRKVVTRLVRLSYINATDASTMVSPLLSSAGSISVSAAASGGFQPTLSDGGSNSNAQGETLLIRDYPENVDEIMEILAKLDARPKQVLIDATILQATLNEDNAFGVDLTVLADFNIAQFTNPLSGVIGDLVGGSVGPTGAAAVSSNRMGKDSSLTIGVMTNSVAAFIEMLDKVTDTTVLARPKLLVLNRQKAELLVGQKFGYISTTSTESSETQTVEFLEVGTQLTVRPFVSEDDYIRMELRPSISSGQTIVLNDTIVPETQNNEMTTNVIVRNGQTVVLGGLFKDSTTTARKQVPWLGDVPFIGEAAKGKTDEVSRVEVIFLVTPSVIKDEVLYAAGERTLESVEHARVGAREGLLPWSRTKMTATHMRTANDAMERGNEKLALWSVNAALSLDPVMVEARRMKEQLQGGSEFWPTHSILKDVTDHMIDMQMMSLTQPEADVAQAAGEEASTVTAEIDQAVEAVQAIESVEPVQTPTQEIDGELLMSVDSMPEAQAPAEAFDVQPATDDEFETAGQQ